MRRAIDWRDFMSQPTSGMKLQQDRTNQAILELQGDLQAIRILIERARGDYDGPITGPVSFAAKKILWNAHSRLISRVTATLGITNPNSLESALARELVG